jgi:flagellar protein FlaG
MPIYNYVCIYITGGQNMSSNISFHTTPVYSVPEKAMPTIEQPPAKSYTNSDALLAASPVVPTVKEMKIANLQGKRVTLGEEELIKAIQRANKALQGRTTSFEFSIHEATKEIMVKVMDKDIGEVIRELPPEKVLDMVAKLWEMAGIIVDERR